MENLQDLEDSLYSCTSAEFTGEDVGGYGKQDFLLSEIKDRTLDIVKCAPLNKVINEFGCVLGGDGCVDGWDTYRMGKSAMMEQVDRILKIFDDALASSEWPEDDVIPDRWAKTLLHDLVEPDEQNGYHVLYEKSRPVPSN